MRHKSAYCTGSSGNSGGCAGGRGSVEGVELVEHQVQREPVPDDVLQVDEQDVVVCPEPEREMRISGSRRRSNGRIASIAASDFTSDSRSAAAGDRGHDANMNPHSGWIS